MNPGGLMRSVAECVIAEIDWASYHVARGPASALGETLRTLLDSTNVDEASEAWSGIEEHVFSQGTIYSAAEPTVSVMLAALLDDQPHWRSGRILDLLFFIVSGVSETDLSLQCRCRERAREGFWLLARWALSYEGWSRDNALEIVEVIAPDRVGFVRSLIAGH